MDREAIRAEVLAVDEAREVATATTTSKEVETLHKGSATFGLAGAGLLIFYGNRARACFY